MCMFPKKNTNSDSIAYKRGLVEFECGVCPECLRRRASVWALRAVHEARDHAFNSMICLTYDQYVHDSRTGKIIGEHVSNLAVCKRDIQLFVKRLRKWCDSVGQKNIKYIATAEYGRRTHRAHYHVLLFGVRFPDCIPYKRSKRGNLIFRSAILESLWKNGICTVDSQSVNASAARYCTKYCTKDTRSAGTFSLFSHNIGLSSLITDFNGKSYIVEGREYPIPRAVWNFVITNRYRDPKHGVFTYKYVNTPVRLTDESFPTDLVELDSSNESHETSKPVKHHRSQFVRCLQNDYQRARFRELRDRDVLYRSYLKYWRAKSAFIEERRKPVLTRILELPDDKYSSYKGAALKVLGIRSLIPSYPAPRSSDRVWKNFLPRYRFNRDMKMRQLGLICRDVSCLNTANDTVSCSLPYYRKLFGSGKRGYSLNPFDNPGKFFKFVQISFADLLTF